MIDFNIYVIMLCFFIVGVLFFVFKDYLKMQNLFEKETSYRRICKKCHVSQILCSEDGFKFWKKTAKSNCECSRFISCFLK